MSVQIIYKNKKLKKKNDNLVLFIDEKFNISGLKKHISSSEYNFILDLIKKRDEKKKILAFDISSKKKIILVSLKKNISNSELENLGANFYDQFKGNKINIDNLDNNIYTYIANLIIKGDYYYLKYY